MLGNFLKKPRNSVDHGAKQEGTAGEDATEAVSVSIPGGRKFAEKPALRPWESANGRIYPRFYPRQCSLLFDLLVEVITLKSGPVLSYLAPLGVLAVLAGAVTPARAVTYIDISAPGQTRSAIINGAYLFPIQTAGSPITASPAGSGIFSPFLQYQANGSESGINSSTAATSGGNALLDDKSIPSKTKDITVSNLSSYTVNGVGYYAFGLDTNETNGGGSEYISMDELEVWVRSSALSAPKTYADLSGSGATKVYDLDQTTDISVLVNVSNGAGGSGEADQLFLLPKSLIDNAVGSTSWNVYFYAQHGAAGTVNGNNYTSDGGFEEWSIVSGFTSLTPPPVVPEKSTYVAGIFMAGAALTTWYRRRKTPPTDSLSKKSAASSTAPVARPDESGFASDVWTRGAVLAR